MRRLMLWKAWLLRKLCLIETAVQRDTRAVGVSGTRGMVRKRLGLDDTTTLNLLLEMLLAEVVVVVICVMLATKVKLTGNRR